MTDSVDDASSGDEQRITAAVRGIVEQRAPIEQAKGMVMFVYGIDAAAAFDVLRSQSQNHNVKLRLVAEQVLKDLVELSRTNGPARRLAFDGLLSTAHRRIVTSAERQLDGQDDSSVRPHSFVLDLGHDAGERTSAGRGNR
jgi:hypothetical protein